MSSADNLIKSSAWGIGRGVFVHSFIYPLSVVRIHQQGLQNPKNSLHVARVLYQQGGVGTFYQGLPPQLLQTSLKQAWVWPMIVGVPDVLERYHVKDRHQQMAATGLSIATIDAAVTTPLERAKILSAWSGTGKLSLSSIYKDGWRGFTTHWAKLSVNWVSALVAQKTLRDRARTSENPTLSLPQLIKIGVQTGLFVSAVGAPFDVANTLKHTRDQRLSHTILGAGLRTWYRGWPMHALSLVIHNVASVILIDKLGSR